MKKYKVKYPIGGDDVELEVVVSCFGDDVTIESVTHKGGAIPWQLIDYMFDDLMDLIGKQVDALLEGE